MNAALVNNDRKLMHSGGAHVETMLRMVVLLFSGELGLWSEIVFQARGGEVSDVRIYC